MEQRHSGNSLWQWQVRGQGGDSRTHLRVSVLRGTSQEAGGHQGHPDSGDLGFSVLDGTWLSVFTEPQGKKRLLLALLPSPPCTS